MPSSPSDQGVSPDALLGVLEQGRRRFLALVADIRPELLRYCARMTGAVADGEDVVQETLARAYYELSQLAELPPLQPWLFRIAHNRAVDHRRHESYRAGEPLEAAEAVADTDALEPDNALAQRQAVGAALSCFLALAPAQRACVILKDVLGHSLDEIAAELELSVPAVKAALHRGRAALQQAAAVPAEASHVGAASQRLSHYAALFNAHDWDGVRRLLADDVRLDLVSQRKAAGRRAVAHYFGNYDRTPGWHLVPAWLDGREVLAVTADGESRSLRYFIELRWLGEQVTVIRDFRYVPGIAAECSLVFARC